MFAEAEQKIEGLYPKPLIFGSPGSSYFGVGWNYKNGEFIVKAMLAILFSFVSFSAYAVSPNDPLPTVVLSCGGSIITDIGSRLEGDKNFETGAHVTLKNGGFSIAYQEDLGLPAIRKSKVGDHVLVCLVYIPKHCPPGDNRGKIYTITNLRTLESWTLPDSQHECGGA